MVTFAPDEIGLADRTPCAAIRADLKSCLLDSDCCKKVRLDVNIIIFNFYFSTFQILQQPLNLLK